MSIGSIGIVWISFNFLLIPVLARAFTLEQSPKQTLSLDLEFSKRP